MNEIKQNQLALMVQIWSPHQLSLGERNLIPTSIAHGGTRWVTDLGLGGV